MKSFDQRLAQLRHDLTTQADRVLDLISKAVECSFSGDKDLAQQVIDSDEIIDRVDVEIERASVPLLAMGVTDDHLIRSVLTIVKVNNELERIADCAVTIGESVMENGHLDTAIPPTFRVMANSVIGILRDSNKALADQDTKLAEQVLAFDDTLEQFKREITLDAQQKVASGAFTVQFAFHLLKITKALERVVDHCTNICEQVIYLKSGLIVRHLPEGWSRPQPPDASTHERADG